MLEFNPYLRKTAVELLDHPFFSSIRVKINELSSKTKVLLDIDRDESYDPKTTSFTTTEDQLKATIYDFMKNSEAPK